MKKLLLLFIFSLLVFVGNAQIQAQMWKGAGITHTKVPPTFTPAVTNSWVAIDSSTGYWWNWDKDCPCWREMGSSLQFTGTAGSPSYTPDQGLSRFALNSGDSLYAYQLGSWRHLNDLPNLAGYLQWSDTFNIATQYFVLSQGFLLAEVDGDPTNELQLLSISNDTIYLTSGGFVVLPPAVDTSGYNSSLTFANDTLWLTDDNSTLFAPIPLQEGLDSLRADLIDSLAAIDLTPYVQYSDSLTVFVTPSQLGDSLENYVQYGDSLTVFVTPDQLSDSLAALPDSIVSGYGVAGYLPQYTGATTQDTTGLYWDATTGRLTIPAGSGTGGAYMGAWTASNDYFAIYPKSVTPGAGNYSFLNNGTSSYVNAAGSGGSVQLMVQGTERARFNASSIGLGSTGTANTQVTIKGLGTTSSTTALLVENSAGVKIQAVLDNGYYYFGGTPNVSPLVFPVSSDLGTVDLGGRNLTFYSYNQTTAAGATTGAFNFHGGAYSATSGSQAVMQITKGFTASSGSAAYSAMRFGQTINQTGTASGAIYGIDYNPTLTSVLGAHYGLLIRSGRSGFGQATPTARTHITGEGTTSSTTALLVENSAGTDALEIKDDLSSTFGGLIRVSTILGTAGSDLILEAGASNKSIVLKAFNGPTYGVTIDQGFDFAHTSGERSTLGILQDFVPTSGTGIFNSAVIAPVINQTGGANGITRGLYINPTLTAAADWRSIEIANTTGYGIYQSSSTLNNHFNGTVNIGTTAPIYSNNSLSVTWGGTLGAFIRGNNATTTVTGSYDGCDLILANGNATTDNWSKMYFGSTRSDNASVQGAIGVQNKIHGGSGVNGSGDMAFFTRSGATFSEKMRIAAGGITYFLGYNTVARRYGFGNGAYPSANYGYVKSSSDGIIQLVNAAETGFNRLTFGPATSSSPSWQKSSANFIARLGDDSANTDVEVLDEAYAVGWNGSNEVPTKNAVYDKIETLTGTTDLTIGGSGPTYTIESSTGADVTISAAGIATLSEPSANELRITATEVDGSITNEIQSISVTGTTTAVIDLSDDASDASITGAGISVVSVAGNAITVTSTEVDGSTTNELQDLSIGGSGPTYTIDISNGADVTISSGSGITLSEGTPNVLSVATTLTLDAGTYVPTLTNTTNISSSTAHGFQYMRVGSTVTVSGQVTVAATAANTTTILELTIPVASAFINDHELAGTGCGITTNNRVMAVQAQTTNDRAYVSWQPAATGDIIYSIHFTYQIL